MGPFDRTILSIYTFCLTIILLLTLSTLLGWRYPLELTQETITTPAQRETVITLIVIFILGGGRLFWFSLRRRKKGKHAVINESSLGQVRISLQAIVSLVEKTVLQVQGVRQVKPRIIDEAGGMSIYINVVVTPDVNIPELSELLQQRVKEYVYNVTGITLNNIKIMVENFAVSKTRVE